MEHEITVRKSTYLSQAFCLSCECGNLFMDVVEEDVGTLIRIHWEVQSRKNINDIEKTRITTFSDSDSDLIKCPGCDLELPKHDYNSQSEHLISKHIEIVHARKESIVGRGSR